MIEIIESVVFGIGFAGIFFLLPALWILRKEIERLDYMEIDRIKKQKMIESMEQVNQL